MPTDLTDQVLGQDLWRYDYVVSGRTFLAMEFFDVYFDPLQFSSLTADPSPSPDWDVLILQQPNPANPQPFDRGIFDAFANVNAPSLVGAFGATFVYLGPGTPGSQPFVIFDANANEVESGFTTPPASGEIPEPGSGILVLLGLAGLACRCGHFSRS